MHTHHGQRTMCILIGMPLQYNIVQAIAIKLVLYLNPKPMHIGNHPMQHGLSQVHAAQAMS